MDFYFKTGYRGDPQRTVRELLGFDPDHLPLLLGTQLQHLGLADDVRGEGVASNHPLLVHQVVVLVLVAPVVAMAASAPSYL